MKLRPWALCLIVGTALTSSVFSAAAEKKAASGKRSARSGNEFKALTQKILDAWGTMDTTKVAPYYSQEPGRLFFDLAPLKYAGWAEYAPGVQKLFFAHFSSVKFTLNPDFQV